MIRLFALPAVLAAVLLFGSAEVSPPAQAISVSIDFGPNVSLNFGRRISCRDGERLLRNRGFRDVVARDCRGSRFVYHGSRGWSRYEITVRSRDGRVTESRRIWRW